MDHPFDDLAVKAAERAIEQTVGMDWPSKDCAQAALAAACNSMKERGKARAAWAMIYPSSTGEEWDAETDPMIIDDSDHQYPVTIFRHGE